ncbi:MAG: hypothetical protein IJA62_04240 [Ruminococcus sp.]|nr:hypothetical protein [Ruminococcus sp.]
MIYYAKDNKLFCTEVAVSDQSFTQITQEEYTARLSIAVRSREKGTPVTDSHLWED